MVEEEHTSFNSNDVVKESPEAGPGLKTRSPVSNWETPPTQLKGPTPCGVDVVLRTVWGHELESRPRVHQPESYFLVNSRVDSYTHTRPHHLHKWPRNLDETRYDPQNEKILGNVKCLTNTKSVVYIYDILQTLTERRQKLLPFSTE